MAIDTKIVLALVFLSCLVPYINCDCIPIYNATCGLISGSDTKTIEVQWNGGWRYPGFYCNNCTYGTNTTEYSCAYYTVTGGLESIGNWNNGTQTFTDTLGGGKTIDMISVTLSGQFSCGNESVEFGVFLGPVEKNGTMGRKTFMGSFKTSPSGKLYGPCCGNCVNTCCVGVNQLVNFEYNYGGINFVQILPIQNNIEREHLFQNYYYYDDEQPISEWKICVEDATIQFHYNNDKKNHPHTVLALGIIGGVCLLCIFVCIISILANLYVKRKQDALEQEEEHSAKIEGEILSDAVPAEAIKKITMSRCIGKGTYGSVFLGQSEVLGQVAVKLIECDEKLNVKESLIQEILIMSHLRHPNILLYMGAVMDYPKVYIVTEYMERGSLFDLLHRDKIKLPLSTSRNILLDAARGVAYLHSCSPPIIHRDLKTPNLLIDSHYRCKIADFGLSKIFDATRREKKLTSVGSPCWTAPEVLRHDRYDEKIDVYSFGICMWETLTHQLLYEGFSAYQVIVMVIRDKSRPPIPNSMPEPWAQLMKRCWDEDPGNRPTFLEIIHILENINTDEDSSSEDLSDVDYEEDQILRTL